jgi:prophage DNA circulation protein
MADSSDIIVGSYKDVRFRISSGSVEGGRKVSIKQFPDKDTQNIEDLGQIPRKYSLEIIVADSTSTSIEEDYFTYRNKLLQALESSGSGVLIHPFYGRIEDVVAVSYSLNEAMSSFGMSTISVNFEIADNTGIPATAGTAITNISSDNDSVQSYVEDGISDNYDLTLSYAGNYDAAVSKVTDVIDSVSSAVEYISDSDTTVLDDFTSEVSSFTSAINSMVTDADSLASYIVGITETTYNLFDDASNTFDAFEAMFSFGEDDNDYGDSTAGYIERQSNNDVINGEFSASVLGYAYLAASGMDYTTSDEIDDIAEKLDTQYEYVMNSEASQDTKDAIEAMRIDVLDLLDEARVTASQVIEIETNTTSTRLLTFAYYGSDDDGQTITDLNEEPDVNFISGTVKVITE